MPKDVFISHSSKDGQIAATICKALEERGIDCWIAPRDIGAGQNFQEAIVRAIRAAKIMVLVFSGNTNDSAEVKKELVLASQHKLAVIPLRTEAVVPGEAFAYELSTRQWVDLFHNWEVEIGRVGEQIRAMLTALPGGGATFAPAPVRAEPKPGGAPKTGLIAAAAVILLLVGAGGFYLFSRGAPPTPASSPASAPVAASPAAQPAPSPATAQQTEIVFWEAIRNGTTVGSYEAYLKQYPDGQFAALARLRIDELTAQTAAVPVTAAISACPEAQAATGSRGSALPSDPALRLKIAQALIECGTAKLQNHDPGTASNEIGVARNIAEGLIASAPGNREYKALLALSHGRTGMLKRAEGDRPGAVREYQATVKLRGEIVAAAPRQPLPLINLAIGESFLGLAQRENGQNDDARQSYGHCAEHRREALEIQPDNRKLRRQLKFCEDAVAAIDAGTPAAPEPNDDNP